MSDAHHIAQLRHAYMLLTRGLAVVQPEFADGLIAPTIRWLEQGRDDRLAKLEAILVDMGYDVDALLKWNAKP